MSGHAAHQVAVYLGSSTRKVSLSAHHLRRFQEALDAAKRVGRITIPSGQEDPYLDVEAHADGCVVQLFAAFDAFACAAAWHFSLPGPKPDLYTFGRLARICPGEISLPVGHVLCSTEHRELGRLRRVAGHRGLVAQKRGASLELGIRLLTADREDVSELLERLVPWGQEAMRALHQAVRDQRWPGAGATYLL